MMSRLLTSCTVLRILWLLSWYQRHWVSHWWPAPAWAIVYLCQILFSFQDVYEFPTVRGIEMFTVCLWSVVIDCESIEVRIGKKNLALNFGGIFWRHFSSKQWEIEIYTRRSSFPFDTRKVNTGFIWQWILRILPKFYGGYFSRFYLSLIKGFITWPTHTDRVSRNLIGSKPVCKSHTARDIPYSPGKFYTSTGCPAPIFAESVYWVTRQISSNNVVLGRRCKEITECRPKNPGSYFWKTKKTFDLVLLLIEGRLQEGEYLS